MKLPPAGARWLVSLRFAACAAALAATTAAWLLGVLERPVPLYVVAGAILAYNLLFKLSQKDWPATTQGVERIILAQVLFDMAALAADALRPAFSTITGFTRAARRAAERNFGACVSCSM